MCLYRNLKSNERFLFVILKSFIQFSWLNRVKSSKACAFKCVFLRNILVCKCIHVCIYDVPNYTLTYFFGFSLLLFVVLHNSLISQVHKLAYLHQNTHVPHSLNPSFFGVFFQHVCSFLRITAAWS